LQAHPVIVKVDILVRDVELSFFSLGAARGYFRDFGVFARRRELLAVVWGRNNECK
jgi:hypothetical protein